MFVGDEGSAYSVLGVDEGVVDGDDIDVVVLDATVSLVSWSVYILGGQGNSRIAEDDTANATEAVDTNLLMSMNAASCWRGRKNSL
jgi:hypothetical protein